MDVAGRSRSRVEERLTRLEEEFGTPEVTRRPTRRQCVVRDGDGAVLLREGNGEWTVPRGRTRPDEPPTAAVRRIVRETAGVECAIVDAVSADIHGIRNEDDESASTVYRLSVVFTVDVVDSADPNGESVRWAAETDPVGELV